MCHQYSKLDVSGSVLGVTFGRGCVSAWHVKDKLRLYFGWPHGQNIVLWIKVHDSGNSLVTMGRDGCVLVLKRALGEMHGMKVVQKVSGFSEDYSYLHMDTSTHLLVIA